MQRPPLFENDCFIYWKNRFETYVKAKDLDLWRIILNGNFPPVAKNEVTLVLEVVPFEEQSDNLKKKLAKNNAILSSDEVSLSIGTMKLTWKRIPKSIEAKRKELSHCLKAKKESSDDETLTSGSDDEEYAMVVRNFKKFFRRKGKFVRQPREEKKSFRQRDEKKGKIDQKCFRCSDPNHLIGDCPKPPHNDLHWRFLER
ncbi:zf-CCHC domain-containing protein [Tanacetum coccineum]